MYAGTAISQTVENDFQMRTELRLSLKPVNKLQITVITEVRLDETFKADKYLIETGLSYDLLESLSIGAGYRYIINPREGKSTEYLNRFSLEAEYSKSIQRWEPSLRIKYTNYTEDASSGKYFRYRARIEYDIKDCKISPRIAVEAFHDLSSKEMHKMRYSLDARYNLKGKNSINLGYMLDYYIHDNRNKHIVNIGFRHKF